jgi:hypothetical protein
MKVGGCCNDMDHYFARRSWSPMMVALKERIAGGIVAAMHRPHEPKSRSTEQKKRGTQQKAASTGTVVLFDWVH